MLVSDSPALPEHVNKISDRYAVHVKVSGRRIDSGRLRELKDVLRRGERKSLKQASCVQLKQGVFELWQRKVIEIGNSNV